MNIFKVWVARDRHMELQAFRTRSAAEAFAEVDGGHIVEFLAVTTPDGRSHLVENAPIDIHNSEKTILMQRGISKLHPREREALGLTDIADLV